MTKNGRYNAYELRTLWRYKWQSVGILCTTDSKLHYDRNNDFIKYKCVLILANIIKVNGNDDFNDNRHTLDAVSFLKENVF